MAFEKWFDDYLLKVRSNTRRISLHQWYNDIYIGKLINFANQNLAELSAAKKAVTNPEDMSGIEDRIAKIHKHVHDQEEKVKDKLMQQLQEQERKYEEKIAKQLASSIMRAIAFVNVNNDVQQPQYHQRMGMSG